jgi:hypothetical protein
MQITKKTSLDQNIFDFAPQGCIVMEQAWKPKCADNFGNSAVDNNSKFWSVNER